VEKRQLTLLHQQRVQAEMDDRKRRLLQKYVEAVDVDEQDVEVSCIRTRQVAALAADLLTGNNVLFPGYFDFMRLKFILRHYERVSL